MVLSLSDHVTDKLSFVCFSLHVTFAIFNRELEKNLRGRRRRQAVNIFRHNPCCFFEHVFALVTLFVQFYFRLNSNCWNIDHVLQTTWKWSNWRLTREQDGTNVRFISHIHVRFLSCVISFIVLPTLPSPSSTRTRAPKSFVTVHVRHNLSLALDLFH